MNEQGMSSRLPLRLFAGGIDTETNVFSPLPTGLRDYTVARPEDPKEVSRQISSAFARYADTAASEGCLYVQGLYAFASPAGVTTRVAYETLRDSLLEELRSVLPLDGVLLTLHGAMVADGYVDCETDLVVRAREVVGSRAKIGVLFDPHCDLPDELVKAADVIVAFKEYPHVDVDERADELAALVIAAARGQISPTMATFDCRMIGLYPTPPEPMRAFVDQMKNAEQQPGILSVSLGHGFPWGDAPAMGTRILVVSDDDRRSAEALAAELGREFFSLRHRVCLQASSMTQALDHALSVGYTKRPVVIADIADNPGGGAPSDSTFVLRELLERDVEDAALGVLWDPIAVQQAFAAGEGAHLTLRLGGKMGPASVEVPCGDCVCLSCGGVDVNRRQRSPAGFSAGHRRRASGQPIDLNVRVRALVQRLVLSLEVFTAFGIDPTDRQLLVVKSTNHFHAAFAPIAAEIIYMSAPGALTFDLRTIPYERVDTLKFPWVDDPWDAS